MLHSFCDSKLQTGGYKQCTCVLETGAESGRVKVLSTTVSGLIPVVLGELCESRVENLVIWTRPIRLKPAVDDPSA